MRVISAGLSIIVLAMLAFASGSDQGNGQHMLGLWDSAILEGVNAVERSECAATSWRERRVNLEPVPGSKDAVKGEWISSGYYYWINTDNGKCRWTTDDAQFQPMLFAVWVYALTGTYDIDRSVIKIHGQFRECNGNGNACERWMTVTVKQPFDTELKLVNGRLVDTNRTPDPSDDIQFVRVSDEADIVDDANTAFEEWAKLLDGRSFDQFYDRATSASFKQNTAKQQFVSLSNAFRERVGATVKRKKLKTVYAVYAPTVSKTPGEYILVINGIESAKKLRGQEFVVLTREENEWKVLWINYGS